MNNIVDLKDLKIHFQIRQSFIKEVIKREKKIVKAVDDIELSIKKGEILSLVGESGSGKTTTGRAILQLVEKTEGNILFDGKKIDHKNKEFMQEFRRRAQMIFQDPYQSLNPRFMVVDIVAEPLQLTRTNISEEEKVEKVVESLEFAGLKPAEIFYIGIPMS